MVKLIHKERISEGSTRRFLDGRGNDKPLRAGQVAKFRESHHLLAKLMAFGLKGTELAARTGYTENTIAKFHNDPAFRELLAKYRDLDTHKFIEGRDEFYSLATKNMVQAERQLSDKMDEADSEGEILPTRELISIVSDRADRFGYGKRETKFNVNVDFADALQRAIKRSGKAIDGTLNEGLGGMKLVGSGENCGRTEDERKRSDAHASGPLTSLLASSTANTTVPQSGVEPEGMPGDLNGCSEQSGSPRYSLTGGGLPVVASDRSVKSASVQDLTEASGHRPLGRAQPQAEATNASVRYQVDGVGDSYFASENELSPVVPPLSTSSGSAGGPPFPARSVEASQNGSVHPGAVESRPLRRRLLG